MSEEKGCSKVGIWLLKYVIVMCTISFLAQQCLNKVSEEAIKFEERKERMRQKRIEERKNKEPHKISSNNVININLHKNPHLLGQNVRQ